MIKYKEQSIHDLGWAKISYMGIKSNNDKRRDVIGFYHSYLCHLQLVFANSFFSFVSVYSGYISFPGFFHSSSLSAL